MLHFEAYAPTVTPQGDGFADLLAELEQSPDTAQALSQGRQWVSEQFYRDTPSIAGLRLAAGLSQQQLGQRVGMKQAHISRYEAGKLEPGLGKAAAMAHALGVDLGVYFSAWSVTQAQASEAT